DLGRRAAGRAQALEVLVEGDEDESLVAREVPHPLVGGTAAEERSDVRRVGEDVGEPPEQRLGEVLVQQESHSAQAAGSMTIRRSRSAAKARQARTSSCVSWGNDAMSSASAIPLARYPRTSPTVMRVPRTHGFPKRTEGSIVIRSRRLMR